MVNNNLSIRKCENVTETLKTKNRLEQHKSIALQIITVLKHKKKHLVQIFVLEMNFFLVRSEK